MLKYAKCFIHIIISLLTIGTISIVSPNASPKNIPLWNWECVNDKCVPLRAKALGKLQSLETCNMLCASMQLWPQPTGTISISTTAVPVRADLFQLQSVIAPTRAVRDHIKDAFDILRVDLKTMENKARGFEEWRSVAVHITVNGSGDPRLLIDTDESYSLWLKPKGSFSGSLLVDITAHSFCGARHGLETLSQLVWLDPYAGSLLMYEAANVKDAPRFRYRGLMVDTARTYFPVGELMKIIDGMAACKLNTFHWHISDAQSFPLQISSVPELSLHGAFSPTEVYTTEQVRTLVRRARLRGIRVLIEINAPARVGRAWEWGPTAGLGDLLQCIDSEPWSAYCKEPPCGQLNPRNPHVYDLLERIYGEIMQLTGVEDIFHLGDDEFSPRCWGDHFKHTEPISLWLAFTRLAFQRLENLNGKLPNLTIMWSSHLTERIKKDLKEYINVIGLQERNVAWAKKYIRGIRTIVSHEDAWDLNSGMGGWFMENGGAPYTSWQKVYEHRPWVRNPGMVVEGGEATVWSMDISEGGLESRVWPRAAALAERLWADRPEGATRPVHARLDVHRARLIARGIKVSPLWSMWCTQNTYSCF